MSFSEPIKYWLISLNTVFKIDKGAAQELFMSTKLCKMSTLITLAFWLIGCQKTDHFITNDPHSINSSLFGSQPIEGEIPDFMFQLIYNGKQDFCQSVRIHQKYLLTSAHCIYKNNQYKDLNQISLAQLDNNGNLITYTNSINRAEIAPGFFKDSPAEFFGKINDLAILEINPSRLPLFNPAKSKLIVNLDLTADSVVSYAAAQGAYDLEIFSFQFNKDLNDPGQYRSSRLLMDIELISEQNFRLFYKEKTTQLKQTPCSGDSGAGVFVQNYNKQFVLVGLLSGIVRKKNQVNTQSSDSCLAEIVVIEKLAPLNTWISQVIGSKQ